MMQKNSKTAGLQTSIHAACRPLLERFIREAETLNIGVSQHETGATIVDAGIQQAGSAEAGRLIA